MTIAKCAKNVRCHVAGCNEYATYNIDTNGFKGSLCLCKTCTAELLKQLRQATQNKSTEKK